MNRQASIMLLILCSVVVGSTTAQASSPILAEYLVNFESSSTGQISGTYGDVKVTGSAGTSLYTPTFGDKWCSVYDDRSIPRHDGVTAAVSLGQNEGPATFLFEFPEPVHEIEFTILVPWGKAAWLEIDDGAGGSVNPISSPVCSWTASRRIYPIWRGYPAKTVTMEVSSWGGDVILLIDDLVGRRLDCPVPAAPEGLTVSPSPAQAGTPVHLSWSGSHETYSRFTAGGLRFRTVRYGYGYSVISTLPSLTGYDLDLRVGFFSDCYGPENGADRYLGSWIPINGPATTHRVHLEPSTYVDEPLRLDYAPRLAPTGQKFVIYGAGFLPIWEEAVQRNYTDPFPAVRVTYQFQCADGSGGGSRFGSVKVLEAYTDRLELVAPNIDSCEPLPFVAQYKVTNARGEEIAFEIEHGSPLPRKRAIRRP